MAFAPSTRNWTEGLRPARRSSEKPSRDDQGGPDLLPGHEPVDVSAVRSRPRLDVEVLGRPRTCRRARGSTGCRPGRRRRGGCA
ncbi:MAG: hypothetical protein MZV64_22920 [Ignavibacteriales bacterium]|nr:hypothetical protein [Ignavibacteriales bacterium]